ncbi:MAG: EutN/CcmL family microcompartment protein [Calditrichia bacterium]
MILGKVCGQINSTINHPFYDGKRLLIVEKIGSDGTFSGGYLIAVDSVGAGADETVLIVDEGGSARQIIGNPDAPLRSIIVGIVDDVSL